MLCEAAGYEVVLVETVGIGQSEVAVAAMVDFFLVLLMPGGGDELQGLKKGVIELADALVVNKADGDQRAAAERTCAEYKAALGLIRSTSPAWRPPALLASARSGEGIEAVWEVVQRHRAELETSGELQRRRREQARAWMWSLVEEGLGERFQAHPEVAAEIPRLEAEVESLKSTPLAAAEALLSIFSKR